MLEDEGRKDYRPFNTKAVRKALVGGSTDMQTNLAIALIVQSMLQTGQVCSQKVRPPVAQLVAVLASIFINRQHQRPSSSPKYTQRTSF